MSEARGRQWRFYIDDMIEFAEKVVAYTDGLETGLSMAISASTTTTTRSGASSRMRFRVFCPCYIA